MMISLDEFTNLYGISFSGLNDYVKKNNYEGFDIFDGLNSRLFKNTIFYKNSFFRLVLIQFCKLCPFNFRKILFVPKGFNPKAGALFLLGNINLFKATGDLQYKKEANDLFERLKTCLIKREKGLGWGYNFDWQARAFFVPLSVPNIVTSVYVGNAMLEYYRVFQNIEALELARQTGDFIINEMILFENEESLCFRYIPEKNTQVHNANLLGAAFLSNLDKNTNSFKFSQKIKKSVNFSISDINTNGSWPYGTMSFHRWVDNFHTAFNIESLIAIGENLNTNEFLEKINQVSNYYFDALFTTDGIPKYYNNSVFPIDIHVIAESVIILSLLESYNLVYDKAKIVELKTKVLNLLKSFQDKSGFFYFQKNKYFWNKLPYIRWGQAWIFYALSFAFLKENEKY